MNAALKIFENLPTPQQEAWKYTNLPAAVKGLDEKAAPPAIRWHGADGLAALSPQDGLVIDVPGGRVVRDLFEIDINAPGGTFAAPRLTIRLHDGAELTVIERHAGRGRFWNKTTMSIAVGKNAKLRHVRVQDYGADAVCTQETAVQIGRDGVYDAFTLTTGAGLSRNEIHAELNGENGACHLNGINLLRGKQHGDTTIVVNHKAPRCESNQFYRTVLDDRAHGVFQGKIFVEKEAQKTDGYQLSNALLLSEGCEMDTKPELEIYADDVKCSHGAATGQIDVDALFYMQSRGIDEASARGLLIEAFVCEVVEKLADKVVEAELKERVQAWLRG